jgi:LPXTG-site transpeptidase (sortase) family protein
MKTLAFLLLMLIIVIIGVFIFYPEIKAEYDIFMRDNNSFRFEIAPRSKEKPKIIAVNNEFGIVVPKIYINAKVINFDDTRNLYPPHYILEQGVAHLDSSAYPGETGSVILISHTPSDLYETTRTNPSFYMMYKLIPGDEIYLYYKKDEYIYSVKENMMVDNIKMTDLSQSQETKMLTFISGWPPGTMFKTQVITATLKSLP